ncbi:MAG: extracellular solute-binding protein [Lachnospiraceae bacterium]|nr:extracellular solute-binding protein [Lachnospiraceae bacterium]
MYRKVISKISKRMPALLTAIVMTLSMTACTGSSKSTEAQTKSPESMTKDSSAAQEQNLGISEDSPYRDKGFDLSKHEDIELYAVGERPQDMDMVLDKVNRDYLEPWLNSTLHIEFISWGDLQTKYSLLLSGGDKVDLIYTSSWCNYNSEVGNGAFLELTPDFLKTYLPYSYEQQAPESWNQISISGKIYAVPKNFSTFTNYNVIVVRSDLLEKTGIKEINSWDTMKEALYAIADNESQNGIYANGQRGSNEFSDHLWWQNVGAETLASGYDFMYYPHGEETLPDWDKDVFYKYLSEDCLKLYLEMAEMADHNVWSPTRINDTSDPQVNFESGKTASIIWNSAAISSGKKMEESGLGSFEVFDVTPDAHAQRDSYANDAMAIPASCKNPERTALVLDCMKGFPEVNNLLLGGIEGVHYKLTEDGKRVLGESSNAYPWGCWAWGIPGKDIPGEYSEDPRSNYFGELCEKKEYTSLASGFSFDSQPVETEMAVVNSIVEEYTSSFNLGLYGDETESKYNEFVEKLKAAGIDTIMEECRKQYEEYCSTKQS